MSASPAQQEEYLNRLRAQVQAQTVQEMMTKMSEKCFKLCAGKRGNHLDQSEATCIVNCMDRYIETMHVVNQAIAARSNDH